uniref:Uncharacterized protein n=1 Tax=Oryza punctata TaxID=4537 RepID=A0A0E0LUV9_ORYPU
MAAAVAAAIQRGRLAASVVVGSAFALGFLWLACAFSIAKAVGHCLAVRAAGVSSVWRDAECRYSIKYVTPVAVVSLILMVVAARREARDEAEADAQICEAAAVALPQPAAAAAAVAPAGSEEDERLNEGIFVIYSGGIAAILLGGLLRLVGALIRLLAFPADELGIIARVMAIGSSLMNVGYLWLAVGHFFLVIPYAVLRLRRVVSKKVAIFSVSPANLISQAAVLGALWLACAVNHCLAVKAAGVSVWADAKCDAAIELAAPAAVVLLILNAVAARREAKAEAEADSHIREPLVAPAPAPTPRPERLRLRGSDAVLMFVIAFIYVCCAILIVVGELLPMVGDFIPVDCQRQCQLQRRCLAWGFKNIGYLWLAVGHFCLIIPYAVLRLRRLARKKVPSFFVSTGFANPAENYVATGLRVAF